MKNFFEFSNTLHKKLYCGENCFKSALQIIISEQQYKSIFFISTNSLLNTDHYRQIKGSIGVNLSGEFPKSQAHTPLAVVNKAVRSIKTAVTIDAIVAFGGSSVVDLAKAVANQLNPHNPVAIISLPTTLSGAEFNANFVVTEAGVKTPVINPLTAPRWIILDPVLSENTSDWLWASTGFKIISDCIEAVCSKNANRLTDQCAYSALQLLNKNLLFSYENPNNLSARQNCLLAPAFSMPAAINTSLGLITACRHQLGARFNIPHGLASAIMMPYILKWNFDFAIHQFAELGKVLDLVNKTDTAEIIAQKFLQHLDELIIKLNLNKKLREFIKDRKLLQEIVKPIMASPFIRSNVRPVTNETEILDLLEAAW